MTGGDDPGQEPGADERALQSGRPWQHPSEVGLARRGRADRKRSTMIASGVLLGGVGLLLSGLVLGTMDESATATTSTLPMERAELSVAHVMPDGDAAHAATAVVLDDDGHLLVDGSVVEGRDSVWVRCAGGEGGDATVVGRDTATGLAVLQMQYPAGVPASVAQDVPDPGTELLVVRAGAAALSGPALSVAGAPETGSARLINLTAPSDPGWFPATVQSGTPSEPAAGDPVFDRSGRLTGMVASGGTGTVIVLAASDAVAIADELLAAPPS